VIRSVARDGGRSVADWVHEVQARGAGEIVLNCMGCDGARTGFDVKTAAGDADDLSGAAGRLRRCGHRGAFHPGITQTGVDAALAASVFHSNSISIPDLKRQLHAADVPVRYG